MSDNQVTNLVEIDLNQLSEEIFQLSAWMRNTFTEEELSGWTDSGYESEPGIDVRIQWFDETGSYKLHTGDSQYDTDHSGNWGYGFIPYDCSINDADYIANELVENLEDNIALG